MTIDVSITNKIRRLRFDHNEMTQQDLARLVGCTRQTINAIELGKYGPSLELAIKIAHVFGVEVSDVFQYEIVNMKSSLEHGI